MTPRYPDSIRRAFYAGSFAPFTIGHRSIADRALEIFDEIVIGVGISAGKQLADAQGRVDSIKRLYAGNPRVKVISYGTLTVDAARAEGCATLVRGVRNVTDFEYELNLADVNRRIAGIDTVFFTTLPELAAVSSSTVRELQRYGRDVSDFLP